MFTLINMFTLTRYPCNGTNSLHTVSENTLNILYHFAELVVAAAELVTLSISNSSRVS